MSILHSCLCAPGASRFSHLLRLAFLEEPSEQLKLEKKSNSERKSAPRHSRFFSIVQSNEQRGEPSVVALKVYRCLESPEAAMMEEKLLVSETLKNTACGLPGAVFFKVSANMTVYLTAKTYAASQFAYLYYALKVCTLFVKKQYILLSM